MLISFFVAGFSLSLSLSLSLSSFKPNSNSWFNGLRLIMEHCIPDTKEESCVL
ncbi:MAG: hypothetical protein N7Q72_04570 [Spiroplasma sp. Tabriz.8]|nr:hypothetical protein [Spiroplasma sp. Tabriz.8]